MDLINQLKHVSFFLKNYFTFKTDSCQSLTFRKLEEFRKNIIYLYYNIVAWSLILTLVTLIKIYFQFFYQTCTYLLLMYVFYCIAKFIYTVYSLVSIFNNLKTKNLFAKNIVLTIKLTLYRSFHLRATASAASCGTPSSRSPARWASTPSSHLFSRISYRQRAC